MGGNTILETPLVNGWSRRRFLGAATAAGLTASTSRALCARNAKAQAKQGGHLRLGLADGATTDSLDSSTYTDNFTKSGAGRTRILVAAPWDVEAGKAWRGASAADDRVPLV